MAINLTEVVLQRRLQDTALLKSNRSGRRCQRAFVSGPRVGENRTTSLVPQTAWNYDLKQNTSRIRPTPASSLPDLHFSLRGARRVNNDQTIDFEGQNYEIATTLRKSVSMVHHPNREFWVVEHLPKNVWPPILGTFSL